MAIIRVGFGRYELGAKDGDGRLINHMQNLEKSAGNATDAFRNLIKRDMEYSTPKREVNKDAGN